MSRMPPIVRISLAGLLYPGLLLLADCGHSPPTRFIALSAVPPAHKTAAIRFAPVQLGTVHIPPTLDRPELVTRAASDRDEVDEQDRWAAPFGQLIRQVLAENLLMRLPAGTLVLPDAPSPTGTRGIVVDILQLRAQPSGRVDLRASWTLMDASGDGVVLSRNLDLSASGRPGGAGQAQAIDALMGQVADSVAQGLSQG